MWASSVCFLPEIWSTVSQVGSGWKSGAKFRLISGWSKLWILGGCGHMQVNLEMHPIQIYWMRNLCQNLRGSLSSWAVQNYFIASLFLMWIHRKTLAPSARTSSLVNREMASNKYSEQKTGLGLASASLWCKHFRSCQAERCLLRSALSSVVHVPLQDVKTHTGHLPKFSHLSARPLPHYHKRALGEQPSGPQQANALSSLDL